jgi:hydrogenase expression/formation protein HypE
MKQKFKNILLGHGSGGTMMHELIEDLFLSKFGRNQLSDQTDAALLEGIEGELAFTTDSFVIDPLFFPGGDIGKLAVCGTVNDLAVSGATPLYISVSFIIEEGFPVSELETIVASLAREADYAGVRIVTGDTKVVNKGKCDKLFINTAGIGRIEKENTGTAHARDVKPGDAVIINGCIGDHGAAVINARESFNFNMPVQSDCSSLNHLITAVSSEFRIRFMRDPTRGGVASVLNELAAKKHVGIEINEDALPVRPSVRALCEILGFDPLHVANEGKVIMVVSDEDAADIVRFMRKTDKGADCAVIGRIVDEHPGRVVLKNETGGSRIVDMLSGDQLPRIC